MFSKLTGNMCVFSQPCTNTILLNVIGNVRVFPQSCPNTTSPNFAGNVRVFPQSCPNTTSPNLAGNVRVFPQSCPNTTSPNLAGNVRVFPQSCPSCPLTCALTIHCLTSFHVPSVVRCKLGSDLNFRRGLVGQFTWHHLFCCRTVKTEFVWCNYWSRGGTEFIISSRANCSSKKQKWL
jgi:hypothetical protein